MKILETEHLRLRHFTPADAAFTLELLNDPAWLRFVGDKNVHTLDEASAYITNSLVAMYERHGHGLFLVELKDDHTPIGMCGLVKREGLQDVDLGFAFLPAYRSKGLAHEAATGTIAWGKATFGLKRLAAITLPENEASGRLLERLGFRYERLVKLTESGPELRLFGMEIE